MSRSRRRLPQGVYYWRTLDNNGWLLVAGKVGDGWLVDTSTSVDVDRIDYLGTRFHILVHMMLI
jgi:hypothetical protein